LTGVQTGIMNRLVIASTTPVEAVMTRVKQAEKVEVQCTREDLRALLEGHSFTRILVYRDRPEQILGFVNVYQVMLSQTPFTSLEPFIKPLETIDEDMPVCETIERMQTGKLKILLVTRTQAPDSTVPVGIVTMKDLAEELLGELAVW
jgi:CBS domain containing-hemolysin-like protein